MSEIMEKEIRDFLYELIVTWGVSILYRDIEELVNWECYEVNEFVREIIVAGGSDPDLDVQTFRRVKNIFIDRFGTAVLDEKAFRAMKSD